MSKITKNQLLARIEMLEKENKQRGIGNQFMTLKCIQGNRHFTKDATYCASELFDRTVITTNFGSRKTLEENTNIFGGYKVTGENQTAVFQIIGLEPELEPALESKPKQLDQSLFDGLDEKWRFAAVDGDGCAYAFTLKPEIDEDDSCFIDGDASKCKWIGKGYDATNWKNSLIERESELKGSDLAKDYFNRGGCPRICFVGEDCDESLSDLVVAMVIGYAENTGFETSYNDFFPYATLVNAYGEELPASRFKK